MPLPEGAYEFKYLLLPAAGEDAAAASGAPAVTWESCMNRAVTVDAEVAVAAARRAPCVGAGRRGSGPAALRGRLLGCVRAHVVCSIGV